MSQVLSSSGFEATYQIAPRVVLNSHSSSPLPVKSGVPQGSTLYLLLFIVYINSLADLDLSPVTSIILYADDILIYRCISSSNDRALLQHDVDTISSWIVSSRLAINPTISRKRIKPQVSLKINSTPVPYLNSVKYLGVMITSDLKWNTQHNGCFSQYMYSHLLLSSVPAPGRPPPENLFQLSIGLLFMPTAPGKRPNFVTVS